MPLRIADTQGNNPRDVSFEHTKATKVRDVADAAAKVFGFHGVFSLAIRDEVLSRDRLVDDVEWHTYDENDNEVQQPTWLVEVGVANR